MSLRLFVIFITYSNKSTKIIYLTSIDLYLITVITDSQLYRFQVNALLMFDAVTVYAKALRGIGGTKAIMAEPNNCANRSATGWSHGFRLINFMRVVSLQYTLGLANKVNVGKSNNRFRLEKRNEMKNYQFVERFPFF